MTDSPAKIRARELVIQIGNAEGPDQIIDRGLAQLFHFGSFQPTTSIDDAQRIIKPYYQYGFRRYRDGSWGAYVEVNSCEKIGFMWSVHKFAAHALLLSALKSHIAEMK